MIGQSLGRIAIAVQFLTRLPLPRMGEVPKADFTASMRWFPLAGLLVGGVVALAAWAGALIDPWAGALFGTAAWVMVTGGLHLDGLADLTDALGAAHRDRQRFLEVMADSRIGSFGVIALALQIAAKLVLLRLAIEAGALWAVVPLAAAARIGPIVWTLLLPPLHQGLGAMFAAAVGWRHVVLWAVALAGAAWVWPGLAAAPLLVIGWWLFLKLRVGGVSGDCHGAGIELVETGLLLALILSARF